MSRPLRVVILLGFSLLVIAFLWTKGEGLRTILRGSPAGMRAERTFEGVVLAEGDPLPDARVLLYERCASGASAETSTDATGRYRLALRSCSNCDAEDLYLLASDPRGLLAPSVLPAGTAGADFSLEPPVETAGRVIDFDGRPVAGATITAALEHGRDATVGASGADGSFRIGGFAPRAPLQIVVRAEGHAPYLEGRFHAGDVPLIRLRRGEPLRVKLIDPDGRGVEGATVSLPGPPALAAALQVGRSGEGGVADLPDACAGGARLVEVEANGYLPAQVSVSPHQQEIVRLWPAREVAVRFFDSRSRAPVEGVAFEVDLMPATGRADDWHGEMFGNALRTYPERFGARFGERILTLPRCRVQLSFAAADYADRSLTLDAESRSASVALAGTVGGAASAKVRLLAPEFQGRLPIIVGEEETGWVSSAVLLRGVAEIEVPTGRALQAASPGASAGFWMPRFDIEALPARAVREMRAVLRPAVRLEIVTDPPVDGLVRFVDTGNENLMRPEEAPLRGGRAELWVRPLRRHRVEVRPLSNHAVKEFDVAVEQKALRHVVALLPAAGFRAEVRDGIGQPVPFARALFWAPDVTGRAQMGRDPVYATADAKGLLTLLGHPAGTAVLEVGAPGFRSRWYAGIPLGIGSVEEAGEIRLEAATRLSGMLVAANGDPVAYARVRVLAPAIARLRVGADREMDLYDLTTEVGEEAVSRENGSFEVEDSSPRAPLLGVQPAERSELSPIAFLPGEGNAVYEVLPLAYVQLALPGSAVGVFLVLPGGRAVKIQNDPPVALRPLPVLVPAGRIDLLVVLRDGRWAAHSLSLTPGEHRELDLPFVR